MELKNFWITGANGAAVANPVATLYLPNTETLASGLQDRDGAALTNPFNGSDRGHVQFAAPDGRYDLKIVGGGREFIQRIAFTGVVAADLASKQDAHLAIAPVITASVDVTLAHSNHYVLVDAVAAVTITVPTDADEAIPIGSRIYIEQVGEGTVTIEGAVGVTVNSRGSVVELAGQFAVAVLFKRAADVWTLSGDLV